MTDLELNEIVSISEGEIRVCQECWLILPLVGVCDCRS